MSIWSLILGLGSIVVLIIGITKISKSFTAHNKTLMPLIEDDAVFDRARGYHDTIRKLTINVFGEEPEGLDEERVGVCRAHYFLGICDYFSQKSQMDDRQFMDFFFAMALAYQPTYFAEEQIKGALQSLKENSATASVWMPFVRLGGQTAQKFSNADEESLFLVQVTFNKLINEFLDRE